MGSHNWPIRPKQRLSVRTRSSLNSFFLKVNLSVCLCHLWSRSVNVHRCRWIGQLSSALLEGHVLICKWAFSRIARQCGWCIISFALVAVSLELPISSRYTCCWSSFAASGNSACDSFSRLIDGVRCSVREQVYHQSLIWTMDKHLVDHLSYSSIETCHAFDRRYAIGFG